MGSLRLPALLAAVAVPASPPAVALAHGSHEQAAGLADAWPRAWSAPPAELLLLVLLAGVYAVAARRRPPAAWRVACFAAGLAMVALALVSPVDAVGEDGLFAVHMLQHTLLGAVAPPLLLLGLTGPMLRPLVAQRTVRRLAALTHPAVAFPLWVATLVVWHVPAIYERALADDAVHALEHACVMTAGLLLWAPVIEPLPAPAWFGTRVKVAYVAGMWFVGLMAANVLWFSGTALYPVYADTAPAFGVGPLEDQGDAGTVMMVTHCLLAFGTAAVLFFRQGAEEQLRQRLVEAGIAPERVDRAGRAGALEHLARRHGVPTRTRAGID
jgi:putative membrane protein